MISSGNSRAGIYKGHSIDIIVWYSYTWKVDESTSYCPTTNHSEHHWACAFLELPLLITYSNHCLLVYSWMRCFPNHLRTANAMTIIIICIRNLLILMIHTTWYIQPTRIKQTGCNGALVIGGTVTCNGEWPEWFSKSTEKLSLTCKVEV